VRVVSFPSWELFEKQSTEYKNKVLPPNVLARVAVEAGTSLGWKEYVGDRGKVIAARYFAEQILPVAVGQLAAIEAGADDLDAIDLAPAHL